MRNKFDEQLKRLHVELIQMGAACEDAISAAAEALLKGDESLVPAALEAERDLDRREREVENLCLKLLLQQQPVARDLREISAALKMISDLERIGDQAADIAELVSSVRLPDGSGVLHIADMTRAVIGMVTDSVDSFVKRDLELADVAVEFIYATLVGSRGRTFVSACPLAEDSGAVTLVLQHLRKNLMLRVVRFLTHNRKVLIYSILHH